MINCNHQRCLQQLLNAETTDEPKTDDIKVVEVDTNGKVTEAVESAATDL